ncbi:MAG: biotin--protein ligase [Candidatus Woesearchaeota archaeon]
MQVATYKIPGGKLVRIKARVEDGRAFGVQISGDFFLAPHEKLVVLEEALEGFSVMDEEAIVEIVEYVLERDSIRVAGFSAQDIAHTMSLLGGSDV